MSLSLVAAAALGIVTWSFMEYALHRWAGHHRRLSRNFFGVEHRSHHSRGHYFAPIWKKGVSAAVSALLLLVPGIAIGGFAHGIAWVSGTLGFYATYELLHRLEHMHGGRTAYGRWARRHHFYHHFHDPTVNHGVTSPLWDVVFGTRVKVTKVQVPDKLMLPWLLDLNGQVRPEFAEIYEIRRKRAA
jgi:sterol desaturase/sphingolipid hydroxylase (fatty acid hydroxylase superfamily)